MTSGCTPMNIDNDAAVTRRCVDFFTDTIIPGLFRQIAQLPPGGPIVASYTAPIPAELMAQLDNLEVTLETMLAKFQRRWSANLRMQYAHVRVDMRERS